MELFLAPVLAVEGSAALLEQGLTISEDVNAIFGAYWAQIFLSPLYRRQIAGLAIIVAMCSLIFFMMRWAYAALHEGDDREAIRSLVWPLIVVALLSNGAQPLALMTRTVRDTLNTVAVQTLEVSVLNVTLEEAIRGAMAKGAITAEISAQIAQCQGMLGQDQVDCLTAANEQIQGTLRDFRDHWIFGVAGSVTSMAMPAWLQSLSTLIQGGIQGATDAADSSVNPLAGFFGGFFGTQFRALIYTFLLAFQWAFVNLIQISMLLTGLMGPIAVAASLLPFGGKPIFAWLTGMVSLGFSQISYNIIVGLAATVIVNANSYDTNGFLVLISILAPALALGLSAGGGMALFNIMLSGTAGMTTLLVTRLGSAGYYNKLK